MVKTVDVACQFLVQNTRSDRQVNHQPKKNDQFQHTVRTPLSTGLPLAIHSRVRDKNLFNNLSEVYIGSDYRRILDLEKRVEQAFLQRMKETVGFCLPDFFGKIDDNLDVKRHQLYLRTIAKQKVCKKFDLATLPPTSAAARQHSFRVYHQVQQWRGVALNPTDWGWRLKDGRLTPLPTLREPAPESLLHLITCNCRSGCERNCECRRSGLPCTSMCGLCAGHGCSNHDTSDYTSDGEDYMSGSDEDALDAAPVPKRRRP